MMRAPALLTAALLALAPGATAQSRSEVSNADTPNIFFAKESDFRPAMMRVFRSPARPSRLEVLVLPATR